MILTNSIMKVCGRCGQRKPLHQFPLSEHRLPINPCKSCKVQRQKHLRRKSLEPNPISELLRKWKA